MGTTHPQQQQQAAVPNAAQPAAYAYNQAQAPTPATPAVNGAYAGYNQTATATPANTYNQTPAPAANAYDPPEASRPQAQKVAPTTITNPLATPSSGPKYVANSTNMATPSTAAAEDSDFLPQMPEEYQPLVNMLNEKLQACLAQGKQSYKRRLQDAQKKLDPLYKKLAYRQLHDERFIKILHDLATALQCKEYAKAVRWQTQLMSIQAQNNAMADIGKSMIGIKAIIHVAKALGI